MTRYDFHSHTHYSDGVLSPAELVARAEDKGLDLLAISDHDSVSGIPQARTYAKTNGLKLKIVDSIELSAKSDFGEIHIVGLNIDTEHSGLLKMLKKQQDMRWQRAEIFDQKLQKIGVAGVMDDLKTRCKDVVTRSHIASALVHLGYAKDFNQAFKKFIGQKGRVKVPTSWIAMDDAISAIHDAGGVAILAHPTRYTMSNRRLGYLIEEFKISNGDAIEVSYPSLNPDKKNWLEVQREKNDLLASGGSDFHYPNLKWSDLGRFPMIDQKIPHVLDVIKSKL